MQTTDAWRVAADDPPPENKNVVVQYASGVVSVAMQRSRGERSPRFRPWYDQLRHGVVDPPILWQPLPAPRRLSE